MVFKEGTTAFIVESNRIIREVIIVKRTGNFYIVRFANSGGGIQIRGSRLFATMEQLHSLYHDINSAEIPYLLL